MRLKYPTLFFSWPSRPLPLPLARGLAQPGLPFLLSRSARLALPSPPAQGPAPRPSQANPRRAPWLPGAPPPSPRRARTVPRLPHRALCLRGTDADERHVSSPKHGRPGAAAALHALATRAYKSRAAVACSLHPAPPPFPPSPPRPAPSTTTGPLYPLATSTRPEPRSLMRTSTPAIHILHPPAIHILHPPAIHILHPLRHNL